MKSKDSNSKKSVSYKKKDGPGHGYPSFFLYDNDKDLKVCFLMTHLNYILHSCDAINPAPGSITEKVVTCINILLIWLAQNFGAVAEKAKLCKGVVNHLHPIGKQCPPAHPCGKIQFDAIPPSHPCHFAMSFLF